MKSLMLFVRCVLKDLGTWCDTSTTLDFKTVERRVEHEGISFLTICLADFGKDFQKSLDQGFVGHDQFLGFSRAGGLPRFLGGFLDRVFDRGSGRLLDNPDIVCIWAIRQFTLMFAKIEIPCSDARNQKALSAYVQCEKDVRASDTRFTSDVQKEFTRMGMLLWAPILSKVDELVYNGEIVPGHGPGKTADNLRGNAKWCQTRWTERLDRVFPAWEMLATGWESAQAKLPDVTYLEPGQELPVKVVLVPKTLKTPRVIAMEPTCMQYMQQGLLVAIAEAIHGDDFARNLIGLNSQEPNQLLAQKGSLDGSLATLDLSEASDRVSNQHVRALLFRFPHLGEAVEACRSRKADVRGHGVVRLAKFASMGSALCFPFEAMVFTTVVFLGIQKALRRPLSKKDVESLLGQVRVYGDDIIVPVDFVYSVVAELESFGIRVNASKSFWNGKFRESCGRDFYAGDDITIVRMRSKFPSRQTDVPELVSTFSFRNQLYKAGLWESARYLDDRLRELRIPLPNVADTSPLLGRYSFLGVETAGRWHLDYQRLLVRGLVVVARIPVSSLDGYDALLKCLTKRGDLPFADVRHLERSGRPLTVSTKQRWESPV